ncbi:IclR family transcriptional regulator [Acidomonas methanolica]|uniref:IclR family transcriptional regulator n=1 Tax=Acidomonas methanolica TaxID=437 RepID=UPI00211A22B2|nr:IclR family transcriptional regulator [Acidomonas methanolica]MCQ9154052.1 IclR family transcriptional regulator [Acidomonas methanolica]
MNSLATSHAPHWSHERASDAWPPGTQTLGRGLSIVHAVSNGARTLSELAPAIGCSRSTTQRLTSALLRRGWLQIMPSGRFGLGPQLTRLAAQARPGLNIAVLSRPILETLAERTRDAVVTGVRSEDRVLCLDGIESRRGLPMHPAVGEMSPLAANGLGQALLLHEEESTLAHFHYDAGGTDATLALWLQDMTLSRARGYVLERDASGHDTRAIALPVRDATGAIAGAIALSSAPAFLSASRVEALAPLLLQTAAEVGRALGYDPVTAA